MEYKPTYTKEEVAELENWFATHTFEKELDMGDGIYIEDVQTTIVPMLNVARTKYENRNFSGQICFLFKMREELLKQNKVRSEVLPACFLCLFEFSLDSVGQVDIVLYR